MNDPRRRRAPAEFAQTIGENQQRGDKRVFGLGPPRPDAPVGIAPPSPLQVQSVFDTRPLAAFDFAFDLSASIADEVPRAVVEVDVPDGYTAVLRTVEIEYQGSLYLPFTGGVTVNLLRSGSTIPYNELSWSEVLTSYRWETHHVFGFWESFGASIAGGPPPAAGELVFKFRFFGTLIPSRSLPVTDEVGSDPVLIREFQPLTGSSS